MYCLERDCDVFRPPVSSTTVTDSVMDVISNSICYSKRLTCPAMKKYTFCRQIYVFDTDSNKDNLAEMKRFYTHHQIATEHYFSKRAAVLYSGLFNY